MRYILIILVFLSVGGKAQMVIKAHANYRPYASPAANLLLDDYPNAAAAYSLRKLDKDYAGSAIRVRRSNDNAESDIGFTSGGDLDTATLKTFVGANSGFVTTWYDQSGNARNATQATAANQPRVVNAGVVDRVNTRPSVRFDGSNDFFETISFTQNNGYYSAYGIALQTNQVLAQIINGEYASGTRNPQYIRNTPVTGIPQTISFVSSTAVVEGGVTTAQNTLYLLDSHVSGTTFAEIFTNGSSNGNTSMTGASNSTSSKLSIGAFPSSSTNYINGNISETILYGTDQYSNRAGVRSNINTYYSIY